MKHYKTGTLMLALASSLALASCTSSEGESPEAVTTDGDLCLTLVSSSSLTRTVLDGTATQHVDAVCLYVYRIDATETEDASGNVTFTQDTVCVYTEDIDWDLPHGDSVSKTVTVDYGLERGNRYIVCAVGYDCGDPSSENTYGFPGCIAVGDRWNQSLATVQAGKTQADIAESEFFSGLASFDYTGDKVYRTITMTRRVTGVMAWFKNIPSGVETVRVEHVECLNKSCWVFAGNYISQYDYYSDPFTSTQTLIELSAADFTAPDGSVEYDDQPETVAAATTFLLPITTPSSSKTYTLRVALYDASGSLVNSSAIALREKENGEYTGNYLTLYPLLVNNLYTLGSESNPIELRFPSDPDSGTIWVWGEWQDEVDIEF